MVSGVEATGIERAALRHWAYRGGNFTSCRRDELNVVGCTNNADETRRVENNKGEVLGELKDLFSARDKADWR